MLNSDVGGERQARTLVKRMILAKEVSGEVLGHSLSLSGNIGNHDWHGEEQREVLRVLHGSVHEATHTQVEAVRSASEEACTVFDVLLTQVLDKSEQQIV